MSEVTLPQSRHGGKYMVAVTFSIRITRTSLSLSIINARCFLSLPLVRPVINARCFLLLSLFRRRLCKATQDFFIGFKVFVAGSVGTCVPALLPTVGSTSGLFKTPPSQTLGPLGSSSFQNRRTPEIVLLKGHASFRITSSPLVPDQL